MTPSLHTLMRIGTQSDQLLFPEKYRKENGAGVIVATCLVLAFLLLILVGVAGAEVDDTTAIRCLMGEARGEGFNGMVAGGEALRNRGETRGVYGCRSKFTEPQWVWDLAKKAWEESGHTNMVNGADYWESTNFKIPYWAKGMIVTAHIGKHKFYRKTK